MKFLTALLLLPCLLHAQIRLTEIAPTNTGQVFDADHDQPDWIELRNESGLPANLNSWGISDGHSGQRWIFPDKTLQPGERLLVYASGKNRGGNLAQSAVNHWETAVYEGDTWQYAVGTNLPPSDWNQVNFNATAWMNGPGGFGYGDGDDATLIPAGTISVYYRRNFFVADASKIYAAILSMDYDDGFVAYLNGQEIARSSNLAGPTDNTTLAIPDHEVIGLPPDNFQVDTILLHSILQSGNNVLAIELHNTGATSSDLSGRTWLHFGIATGDQFFGPTPFWFSAPGFFGNVELHTDFKLNFSDKVVLYNPQGNIADSISVGILDPGHARMRLNDTGNWCITDAPTPGAANGSDCLSGYAAAPVFSKPAGFYSGSQQIAISGAGQIRYSTDGSVPDQNSAVYATPISIPNSKVLRARCFENGKLPSKTSTATYLIDEPTTLPVVSISLPPSDFDDVYTYYDRKGQLGVEYFDKDRERKFSGEFSGYVVGNWSVSFNQKSLQFDVDEEYGSTGEIHFPIFGPDKPITDYHSFRIRNEDDDWIHARMRDRIVNELAATTFSGRASFRNITAFINGEYWGHYVARERLDNYFVRDNYGADPDSVNMVKTHFGLGDYLAEYGTIDDFYAMSDFIANTDMSAPGNFKKATQLLDIENFTDYLETEIFVANTDWMQDFFNNVRLFKTRKNAGWKFLLWDSSYSSGNPSAGSTCASCDVLASTLNHYSRYAEMLRGLLENNEYRRYFINRFADLMNTSFLPAKALNLINTHAAEMGPEMDRHNARWGTGSFNDWSNEVQLLRNFYQERPEFQRQHIRNDFQLGQEVSITLQASPPGAGTVKISTVIPPALPWTGIYFHGNAVTVTAIPNPGFKFDHWSNNPFISNSLEQVFTTDAGTNTTFTANFTGQSAPLQLRISEINYHSDATRDGGDWFELNNESAFPVDLSGFGVGDKDWFHHFEIPDGTVIQAHDYLVFSADLQKFTTEYPLVNQYVAKEIGFELSDHSDEIHLYDRAGNEIANAAYNNSANWPQVANGYGLTLERRAGSNDATAAESWFAGCVGGSPGSGFEPCPESSFISEINYHSAANADAGDWIELHHIGQVDLSGWRIRDDNDSHLFVIPSGTVITSDNPYLVLYEDKSNFESRHPDVTNKLGPLGFGLGNGSDLIRLYEPNGRLYLSMQYRDDSGWPAEADGQGYTLEKTTDNGLLTDPASWTAGCPEGSPGKAYDPNCGVSGSSEADSAFIQVSIWPNPASASIFVETTSFEPGQIEISDILGRLVASGKAVQGTTSFNTETWPSGAYQLRFRTSKGEKILKFMIQ